MLSPTVALFGSPPGHHGRAKHYILVSDWLFLFWRTFNGLPYVPPFVLPLFPCSIIDARGMVGHKNVRTSGIGHHRRFESIADYTAGTTSTNTSLVGVVRLQVFSILIALGYIRTPLVLQALSFVPQY